MPGPRPANPSIQLGAATRPIGTIRPPPRDINQVNSILELPRTIPHPILSLVRDFNQRTNERWNVFNFTFYPAKKFRAIKVPRRVECPGFFHGKLGDSQIAALTFALQGISVNGKKITVRKTSNNTRPPLRLPCRARIMRALTVQRCRGLLPKCTRTSVSNGAPSAADKSRRGGRG